MLQCLQGLKKAMDVGWYHPSTFNQDEYELLDNPSNADMHFLSPKFVAFKGPSHRRTKIMPGVYTFSARHYASIFKERGITAVVRLNEASTYDREEFIKEGIKHHDLYFDDCTVPSNAVVLNFLNMVEAEKGVVAVHCKAGLGRTGTLIAIYWMKHFRFTASECIGWQRIVRPGCIIGPQQQYLHWAEAQFKSSRSGQPSKSVAEPAQVSHAQPPSSRMLQLHACTCPTAARRCTKGTHGVKQGRRPCRAAWQQPC